MQPEQTKQCLQNAWILAKRDLVNGIVNPIFFTVLTIALFSGFGYLKNQLTVLMESGILILEDPLYIPMLVVILTTGIYASFGTAFAISREKESGTLTVLFFGPVTELIYLIARLVEQTVIFLSGMLVAVVVIWNIAGVSNLPFSPGLWTMVLFGLFYCLALVTLGAVIAVGANKVRQAVVILLIIYGLFFGLQIGFMIFRSQSGSGAFINYLQDFLSAFIAWLKLASPFSYLLKGIEGIQTARVGLVLQSLIASIIFTGINLGGAVWLLRRKGVR